MNKTIKKRTNIFADILCIVVAIIWGSGFIASQKALDANMSAALIMAMRFSLAAAVMLLICLPKLKKIRKQDLKYGIISGVMLFAAFYSQTKGQQHTTVSHCAFLTATNVVMVPLLLWLISKKRPATKTFVLAGTTLVGISLLTLTAGSQSFSFNKGDALSLLGALFFAMHIISLKKSTENSDVMIINLIQLSTAAIISIMLLFTTDLGAFSRADFSAGLPAVIYLGLFSTCLCYFLQTLAQKYTSPTKAGVLLATEGLFGTMFSVLLGMELLTANMAIGGAVILLSVILMEVLPTKKADAA